ncbi:unnamed protein product [Rangifer tarandus platyrhynchus]|uniref:Uncharacterized protein n=1 Tax=Rangifer tarandus platyrhynchus TaxID=3082113 RepID=A0AC59YMD0_RANTA
MPPALGTEMVPGQPRSRGDRRACAPGSAPREERFAQREERRPLAPRALSSAQASSLLNGDPRGGGSPPRFSLEVACEAVLIAGAGGWGLSLAPVSRSCSLLQRPHWASLVEEPRLSVHSLQSLRRLAR